MRQFVERANLGASKKMLLWGKLDRASGAIQFIPSSGTAAHRMPEPVSWRRESGIRTRPKPVNYQSALYQAFGPVFAETFPAAYTRKYWTTNPANLGVDWIGLRVFYPNIEDVVNGAKGPLGSGDLFGARMALPSKGGFSLSLS